MDKIQDIMKEFCANAKGTVHEFDENYISIYRFENLRAFFNSDSISVPIIRNMFIYYDPCGRFTKLTGMILKDSVCIIVVNSDSEDVEVTSDSIRFFINVRGMDYTAFRKAVGKAALTAYQYFREF